MALKERIAKNKTTKQLSIKLIAKAYSGRSRCTDCPVYKRKGHICCYEDMIEVCDYAFTKGFVSGVKYHKKQIKEKNND